LPITVAKDGKIVKIDPNGLETVIRSL